MSILDTLIRRRHRAPRRRSWGPDAEKRIQSEVEGAIDTVAHGHALLTVAQAFMWGGKYEESRLVLERARALSPDDWLVYYVSACWAQTMGKIDEAISWQRQALERDPDDELLQRQLDELVEMQRSGETSAR